MHKHTNQLIHETSPYLLQHAHNPVDWFPWNEETLKNAKDADKPILISIGYSACHWCHVMEKESFEDEETAALMNRHFINIKIDREERPDLDHIYMDAVQAMTGSGGWPLNVFLTPDAKPFYGGTYFPPRRAYNRISWKELLENIAKAFREKRTEIDSQALQMTEHLVQSNSLGLQQNADEELFKEKNLIEICHQLLQHADREWGGFGNAPKFPQTFIIQFLLRTAHALGKTEDTVVDEALSLALLSLDKMIEGGIYDQVGGGFARYSTDREWLVPHFEKMLYDNALLMQVLCEAYQLTGKERYKEVIEETMEFVRRELMDNNHGFYAALDADSEGVEGKFYVWNKKEVEELLGNEAALFCEYYDITEEGNWREAGHDEGKNILRVRKPSEEFAKEKNIPQAQLKSSLEKGRNKLLAERSKRIRPGLDDKIILGWNALMNIACSKAFAATGNEEYRKWAITNMQFLLEKFTVSGSSEFYHVWKNDIAKYPAFIDDYAFLVAALIQLQEITADSLWLEKAGTFTEFVISEFSSANSFFYYTKSSQRDVIIRKKEVYDGAVASGNSVMAWQLYHLSILLNKPEWKERSVRMLGSLGNAIVKYPSSFGHWACLLQEMISGTNELTLVGNKYEPLLVELLRQYVPNRVLMASEKANAAYPLLSDKSVTGRPLFWLCRDYSCKFPVSSVSELISLINSPDRP